MELGPRYDPQAQYVVKAALFDVDNTLVDNESRDVPTERFKRAVLSAEGRIKIGLTTARGLGQVDHILRYIQAEGLSILCNGAQIIDSASRNVVAEWTINPETCREVVAYAQSQDLSYWINEDGDDLFPGHFKADTYERLADIWDRDSVRVQADDFSFAKTFVIVLHDITDAQVDHAASFITQHADKDVALLVGHQRAQPDGVKTYDAFIAHRSANKRDALHYVANAQGLEVSEIMAVGDGRNDAELIGAVAVGVAMGNSAQETLDVATFITANRQDDGAAIALEYAVDKLAR